ncbi:hypothetical protein TIFTF001_026800 [Ficus carica]|uniref:DUF8040 domain-containing protein n=1 Tax=Ficus carica TaxID=3494 RepID=A0AA88DLX8_FICCA|nr:hypothetical protein TIFTF001_026800 [Ficus carica]
MNWFRSATRRDEDAHTTSTSDAQREDDDMCARAVVAIINSRRNIRRNPQPMHDSMLTGSMRVEEILNGHEDVIQSMISMKSSTFRLLSNLLGGRGVLRPTSHMNVNEQLFIFLAICSQGRSDDVNEDYVLDEGIDDTGPSTGTDQHGSMNQLRERMADAMWERYQSYPWYRAT